MVDSMQNRFKHLVKGISGVLGAVVLVALVVPAAQAPESRIPAGTRLRVQFQTSVGSAISRAGDGVEVRLLKPVATHGREGLPVATVLTGRVLDARPGNKRSRTFPMLRLKFEQATLPDGREFPLAASLADLGVLLKVDSEGAVMPPEATLGQDAAVAGTSGAIGAGVGGIAGGRKGAATGAGIGAAVGILADLAAHSAQWEDFTLKKGRKAWLRLDADLEIPVPSTPPAEARENPGTLERPRAPSSTGEERRAAEPAH